MSIVSPAFANAGRSPLDLRANPVYGGGFMTKKILLATVLGIAVGSGIHHFLMPDHPLFLILVSYVFDLGGQLFLTALKMMVVPLVFVSLTNGIAGIQDTQKLGRISRQTLSFFILSTILAISMALFLSSWVDFKMPSSAHLTETLNAGYTPPSTPSIKEILLNLIPSNPIQAFASGNILQVIVFALLLGFALSKLSESGQRVQRLLNDLNAAFLKIILLVIQWAPMGAFCLLAKTFAENGWGSILPLAKYFFTLLFILLLQGGVVFGAFLKLKLGLDPRHFFRKLSSLMAVAFSTSSSNATLPLTLEVCEKKLGINPRIASFVIPLGATINMNGTSIMQAVALVFIAQVYQIPLTAMDYVTATVMATLAAVGTAGVPGVGLVMLAMVLQQLQIPVEGIGLILGVDRLLDMVRTVINVLGDVVAALYVAKSDSSGQDWDETTYAQLDPL